MNTDHVRAHQSVPIGSVPEVTGLLPVACAHCGDRVYVGLPVSIRNLEVLVGGFAVRHADCPPRGVEDADE